MPGERRREALSPWAVEVSDDPGSLAVLRQVDFASYSELHHLIIAGGKRHLEEDVLLVLVENSQLVFFDSGWSS